MVLYKYLIYKLSLLLALLQASIVGQYAYAGEVFLAGGATPNQGVLWVRDSIHGVLRVYVGYEQSEKLIDKQTIVACRMLDLPGEPRTVPFSTIRHREKVFVVEHCHGNETSLFNCSTIVDSETNHKRQLRINCGRPSVNVEFLKSTNQSSVGNGSSSHLALDHDINTCFITKEEENPWIELILERTVYIHEITMITNNAVPAAVKTSNNKTGQSSYCSVTMDTGYKQTAKCSIEFKTNIIRIGLSQVNRSLSLCWLQVAAFDSSINALGITHRHWIIPSKNHSVLKLNVEDTLSKTDFSVMTSFDFLRAEEKGIVKLHALMGYLLVSKQGRYIVSAMFNSQHELWIRIAKEPGLDRKGLETSWSASWILEY
ncbi:uncharacterized protein LOC116301838 [Actinia tenebrosa]|uniref:Uncharacterized protein LOC116301838 n=1 Tax=Actinia tenebrosa TaxID=6105 RepID=A0A6P8IJB6_ACTTE|nr:uncharacterized protein LOC116301838 [Actinia tenebrosa]